MDDQERAARLAALILALRSGGAQTIPNANPAALGMALRGQQQPMNTAPPVGLERINGAKVPNPNPAQPLPMPITSVRG